MALKIGDRVKANGKICRVAEIRISGAYVVPETKKVKEFKTIDEKTVSFESEENGFLISAEAPAYEESR